MARALLIGLLMLAAGPADAQRIITQDRAALVTDISKSEIAITSSFAGTDLLLFGAVLDPRAAQLIAAEQADIIIVVRGPKVPTVLWRKQRIGGIWINRKAVTFTNAPGYYALAANRPLEEIATLDALRELGIGANYLQLNTDVPLESEHYRTLRAAMVEVRRANGLFIESFGQIKTPGGNMFRTDITFPANVPVGDYMAEVYLFLGGLEIDRTITPLNISKQGIERTLYRFAYRQPWLYGLTAVLIAMLFGWSAAVIFRR